MSVLRPGTASTMTSPPRPPSPPFGPPNSMNFSRRNETQPLPPSPDRIWILASSRNFMFRDIGELTGICLERARLLVHRRPERACRAISAAGFAASRGGPLPHPARRRGRGRMRRRLGHAARGAPALERGPDRALEPEPVDRRRALERADPIDPDPRPLESAFLEHAARSRIGHAGAGLERLDLEILERVVDQ